MAFEKLSFTKDWNNASDFPTYEENEAQVRSDMQLLHDEVKDFINEKLIPGIEGLAVPGTGDMLGAVYDPTGKKQDVFAYAAAQAKAALSSAKSNTSAAITNYDTTQAAKLDEQGARITNCEAGIAALTRPVELFAEYRTAGTYTVTLPADTNLVYVLAVGAGGGGQGGHKLTNGDMRGGAGGAGGNAAFFGPILPGSIANKTVVVGAGGAGGTDFAKGTAGGDSTAFGVITASGGIGGGSTQPTDIGGQLLGGAGGGGGSYVYDDYNAEYVTSAGAAGRASGAIIPMLAKTFSAGGGGGGVTGATTGLSGGTSGLGSGGKGGNYKGDGSAGNQCCGGGGAGAPFSSDGSTTGGKGGDGYVAIWIQRTGVA